MAASSVSMPMGRPSPEWTVASAPVSGIDWCFARRTSASLPRSPPMPASTRSTAPCSTSGLSSYQLADTDRGFGFRAGGPLDMRFDASRGVPAAELLATLDADELTALFRRYGEEPQAAPDRAGHRRDPRDRTDRDRRGPRRAASSASSRRTRAVHVAGPIPATRVFQALRIAVNEELDALQDGLAAAVDLLRPGGRLVVLSYHSLEDRIVKRFFAAERRGCVCPPELPVCVCGRNPRLRLLTSKPVMPTTCRGRGQSTRPQRSPAGRRTTRRVGRHPYGRRAPMSKGHHNRRRKAYGRRQHEVHERHDRSQHAEASAFDQEQWGSGAPSDPLSFLDPRTPRFRFAIGD